MEQINVGITKNFNENEFSELDDAEYDYESELLENDQVEMNNFDSQANDYLLVGVYGNGSAYLKTALHEELKDKAYKIKFMAKLAKDKTKPKKIVAELYQIQNKNNYHLVLLTKQNFTDQSYKFVIDYLKNINLTYKRVVVYDSKHSTNYLTNNQEEQTKNLCFCLKNTRQLQSNQLIRVKSLPVPNTISEFSAYLITYHDFIDVPCVVYIAITNLYEVCLESVRIFNESTVSYEFLRDKLTEEYFISKNIPYKSNLFKEYNAFKNLVYS